MSIVAHLRNVAFASPYVARILSALGGRTLVAARLIVQLAKLWAIGTAANVFADRTHLPVPGNSLAMLLTFGLLASRLLQMRYVEAAATLLVRHLTLFFIPYAVGIAGLWSVLAPQALHSFGVLFGSALLGIGVAGWTAQHMRRMQP